MTSPPLSIDGFADAQEIAKFVTLGRETFRTLFREDRHSFDDTVWDIRHLRTTAARRSNSNIYFTRYGSRNDALPAAFSEVVKTLLALSWNTTSPFRLDSFRLLWEAILARLIHSGETFSWSSLRPDDVRGTEEQMLEVWSENTTNRRCNQLIRDLHSLAARGIAPDLYLRVETPRHEDLSRHTIAGNDAALKKRPSPAALTGVADIYSKYATEPEDRLLSCALAILAVGGLRIGEVLTLPVMSLVKDTLNGKERTGLRYNKEKSRNAEEIDHILWLTPLQASVITPAIEEVRHITEPARRRARELEADPNRIPMPPGLQWNQEIDGTQLAGILGMGSPGIVSAISASRLPRRKVPSRSGPKSVYRVAHIANYLLSIRTDKLWTVNRRDGTYQMLSESLFITFRNFFHPARGTNPLLVEPVSHGHVSDFIAGRAGTVQGTKGVKSAFERFGIREESGEIVRMNSHQFRHWVTDTVAKGGATDSDIARWQGREQLGDINAYKHMSSTERIEWAKRKIRQHEIQGDVAEMYFSIAEDTRDLFLDNQLQAVHFTPLGLCIHDFSVSPCPYKLSCLGKDGCREFLHDTTSTEQRQVLVQLVHNTTLALDQARTMATRCEGDLSPSWVKDAEDTITNATRVLNAQPQDGATIVRPFAQGESRYVPLRA
jgi:integrase